MCGIYCQVKKKKEQLCCFNSLQPFVERSKNKTIYVCVYYFICIRDTGIIYKN